MPSATTISARSWKDQKDEDGRMQSLPFPLENEGIASLYNTIWKTGGYCCKNKNEPTSEYQSDVACRA